MQTPGEKEKLDRLTAIVCEFAEIAGRLGLKFKVAGDPHPCKERNGTFQLKRCMGVWSIVWLEEGEERRLQDSSLYVKRLFLLHASRFFDDYVSMAKAWESTVDKDIAVGEKALMEVRKVAGAS